MKILSIDVGIKNLAYCIIEKKNNSQNTNSQNNKSSKQTKININKNRDVDFSILEWDVINICREKNYKCIGIKKNKKPCENKAKYYLGDNYYCKTHAKNLNVLIPTNKDTILMKKIEKKTATIKLLKQFLQRYSVNFEKNIKKIQLIELVTKFYNKKFISQVEEINSNNLNMIDCGILLKRSLDKNFNEKEIDLILIENQIGPLALRMKMVQGMITQHFIENGKNNIDFVNASNKLKDFLGDNKKTSYSERKKLSIIETRKLLETKQTIDNKWLGHFNKHSKKDDLADSLLQAIWYIKRK